MKTLRSAATLAVAMLGMTSASMVPAQELGQGTQEESATTAREGRSGRRDGDVNRSGDAPRRQMREERRARNGTEDGERESRRRERVASDQRQTRERDIEGRVERRRGEPRERSWEGRRDGEVSRRDFGRDGGNRRRGSDDRPASFGRFEDRFDRDSNGHRRKHRDGRRDKEVTSRNFGHFEDRLDRRQSRQRERIRDGWDSGDLTRRELKRLRKDQHKIARVERRFGEDGRYTREERHKLNRLLGRSSDRIQRAKHNGREQWRNSGRHGARNAGFEDRVDRRQSKQRARIRDGWENGDLSRREVKALRKDQRRISRMERRFGEDDRYTKRERRKMTKALDRSSHRIRHAKNNDRYPRAAKHRGRDR